MFSLKTQLWEKILGEVLGAVVHSLRLLVPREDTFPLNDMVDWLANRGWQAHRGIAMSLPEMVLVTYYNATTTLSPIENSLMHKNIRRAEFHPFLVSCHLFLDVAGDMVEDHHPQSVVDGALHKVVAWMPCPWLPSCS